MKRIYPAIIGFLLLTQTVSAQVRYGIQGSFQQSTIGATVNLSSLNPDLSALPLPINTRAGFRAGLMADVPVTRHLSVRPHLLFSVKGGDVDAGTFVRDLRTRFNLPPSTSTGIAPISKLVINYVELPVQVIYGLRVGLGQVVAGVGPYAALAVGGTVNGEPINFSTTNFHKLDLGGTASLGYELPAGLTISAYYSQGFTNISKNATPDLSVVALALQNPNAPIDPSAFGGTLRNKAYGITLGYFFRRSDNRQVR